MTTLINGKETGQKIQQQIKLEVNALKNKGIEPCLAVILVGDDPASQVYVRNKKRTCGELGILSLEHKLPSQTSQDDLEGLVKKLNEDSSVHGILCQFPLPQGLNEERVIHTISTDKDVDGLHPFNVGLLATGKPRFISCTPWGVMQLLKHAGIDTEGKHAVVLGRSNLVGRPLSILLSEKSANCTVTVCHSRTKNLASVTSQADILVAAIGRPEYVTADMVKPGAVVIDVGINRIEDPSAAKGSRLVGDVAFETAAEKAEAITPVPGGVGPMTIAMLMANTVNAARIQNGLEPMEI
ncbi:MAG: bifunctional methylenetetrahydrofolate dehydrogenase/methenyltetrahydrofolate cyclohydrolase FolD [SAR324 cluster bacterium]|jgi:methylenetetrahydrofolate dehydrogenase (NADP+)/methenyltetrahydrofolate cyclohydrolase|nr:bifunctional methylenetetrahydrofolate dehydrogenase/methenyltetrahydrofolate cyclohydrolase FolD [Deltaproteobacteria bacterium]MDP6092532.1 bifunctional methylenetetrahydrofolate dehydrogenase/methenyltetrahydrofolate cyclohydrolase FolD [SAR324 cluster bacterium]MAA91824.1 bifunctional methylenetetrahydrofolate dehydrogenase/methenyltetrahydrofolate cyclohydrolase FolD [Deltaproteobacteria bacterium]MDP6462655.1 bifunctional methylenetetrahydrofolate dehydrogenase/methenyltetrahydrofolate |tara:strand:+ start:1817 stop:2707 length:891 start_codon:yes stop_codon:yes gene_type:complete